MNRFAICIATFLLVVASLLIVLPCVEETDASDGSYVYLDSDGTEKTIPDTETVHEVKSHDTKWSSQWNVVNGHIKIGSDSTGSGKKVITVEGDVNLVIPKGCSLTLYGEIRVLDGNSITIYGGGSDKDSADSLIIKSRSLDKDQLVGMACIGGGDKDNPTGEITVNSGVLKLESTGGGACIGGRTGGDGGDITIDGGYIKTKSVGGAGIGGGGEIIELNDRGNKVYTKVGGDGGDITINGGTIEVISYSQGAAIGGGEYGDGGTITIYDVTMTAKNGSGAGIGGGIHGSSGDIFIKKGNIEIKKGSLNTSPCIGSGYECEDMGNITIGEQGMENSLLNINVTANSNSPAIGSGSHLSADCDGVITINGGIITAIGGTSAAGIGMGNISYLSGVDRGKIGGIVINGGVIYSTGGNYGAGIGSGFGQSSFDDPYVCEIHIEINGGTVTATGGICAPGIGNGVNSTGAEIKINGGVVKATGTGGVYSKESYSPVAIGHGLPDKATDIEPLSVSVSGSAIVDCTGAVKCQSKTGWIGMVFEDKEGEVFGAMSMEDASEYTIQSDYSLTIGEEASLTLSSTNTLTNNGKIILDGGELIDDDQSTDPVQDGCLIPDMASDGGQILALVNNGVIEEHVDIPQQIITVDTISNASLSITLEPNVMNSPGSTTSMVVVLKGNQNVESSVTVGSLSDGKLPLTLSIITESLASDTYPMNISISLDGKTMYDMGSGKAVLIAESSDSNLTVEMPNIDVTWPSDLEVIYGSTLNDIELKGTATYEGNAVDGSFSWVNGQTMPTVEDSDSAEFEVKFTPESMSDYPTMDGKVKVKVSPCPVDVTVDGPSSIEYGMTFSHSPTYKDINGEASTGVSISYSDGKGQTIAAPSDVDSYSLTATIVDGNYMVSRVLFADGESSFKITAANIDDSELSLGFKEATYSGEVIVPGLTVVVNGSTLVEGTDYSVSKTDSVDAGSYKITVTGMGNYAGSAKATYEIAPKELVVTVKDVEIGVGDPIPEFEIGFSGFVGDDGPDDIFGEPAFSHNYVVGGPAGEYEVTVSGLKSGNYDIEFVPGTLAVIDSSANDDPVLPPVYPDDDPVIVPPTIVDERSDDDGGETEILAIVAASVAAAIIAMYIFVERRR